MLIMIIILNKMYEQILSPYTPMTKKSAIKKDGFIKFKKQNIQECYKFQQKPIGQGGYGTVYLTKLKQPPYSDRCVKIISKKLLRKPQVLMNQINIMKQLDHPNIVKLYEAYEDQTYLYLVEDICQGGELFDRLSEEGSFNQDRARRIFKQMTKIVKYLHLQKICHRDLKAQNFLFYQTDGDSIALIDFGLSFKWQKDMKTELEMANENKVLGTSYYVSPQILTRNYDEKCDIWSLGVLLHIITTASAPFPGESDSQILQKIRTTTYKLTQQASNLSPQLQDLIINILKPVEQRFTLDQILSHPWMNVSELNEEQSVKKLDYEKMKKFSSFSKLKAIFLAYIATQLPSKQLKQLGQLFQQVDVNNDGDLTVDEFQLCLQKQGVKTNSKQLHAILKTIDMDKNGKISYNEFLASCLDDHYCKKTDYIDFIFNSFAKENRLQIQEEDLRCKVIQMGLQLPQRLVSQIMSQCNLDKDHAISYEEFVRVINE